MPNVPKLKEERTALLQLARDFAERLKEYEQAAREQLNLLERQVMATVRAAMPEVQQFLLSQLAATGPSQQAAAQAVAGLQAMTALPLEAERRRMAAEAAQRIRAAAEAQREEALRRLSQYGVDPTQARAGALDRAARVQEGALTALAANQGAQQAEAQRAALLGAQGQLAGSLLQAQSGNALRAGALQTQLAQLQALPLQARAQSAATASALGQTSAGLYGSKAGLDLRRYEYQLQKALARRGERMGLYGGLMNLGGVLGGAALGGWLMQPAIPAALPVMPTYLTNDFGIGYGGGPFSF